MNERLPQLTLDANVVQDYSDPSRPSERHAAARQLFELVAAGTVHAAVTDYLPDDIDSDPLVKRLPKLPTLGVSEIPSAFELGRGRVGENPLASDRFEIFFRTAVKLARTRCRGSKSKPPDDRDWSHLHAHLLAGRDVFLTSDKGILCLEAELQTLFGIRVMSPQDFIGYSRDTCKTRPQRRSPVGEADLEH